MRPTVQARRAFCRAMAVSAVGAVVFALSATSAGADTDPALFANVANLHELVELARRDVQYMAPSSLTSEHRRSIDRAVRETAQARLKSHLANLSGQPHFDTIWTHYIVEGRRRTSPATRQYHLRACPICNVAVKELARNTGVSSPDLVVPFATVRLGDAYFKVDAESGRIYRIIDPIKGTPSFVSTGRLVLSDGRWWVVNGTQRTGPIRTRDSTRLPWDVHSQANAEASRDLSQPPGSGSASATTPAPSTAAKPDSPARRSPSAIRLGPSPRSTPPPRSDSTTQPAPVPRSASMGRVIPLGRAAPSARPATTPPTPAGIRAPAPATARMPARPLPTVRAPAPAAAPATVPSTGSASRQAPPGLSRWPAAPATASAAAPPPPAAAPTPSPKAPAATSISPATREAILRRRPIGPSRAIPASELLRDAPTSSASSASSDDDASTSPSDGKEPARKPFWQ